MKNIAIYLDGTGQEWGKNVTNVVKAYECAVKSDSQVCFYDPGIGCGGWQYEEESGLLKAKSDQATGYGLQKNVEEAYRFLMASYEEGDKVFLFGFSRGAFTARALAGMLYRIGLLRRNYDNLVEYASKTYMNLTLKGENGEIATGFKRAFCVLCSIYFIGVWDTVESLALTAGRKFYNYELNPEVKFGYHAMAIDERRADFQVCLWDEMKKPDGQTIEQVFFPGCHSDVGGWYDDAGLSNGALQWMMDKALRCGLEINRRTLTGHIANPDDGMHESYTGFWIFRGEAVRIIPDGAMVHASARDRMNNPKHRYKPDNLPANVRWVV